MLEIKTNSFNDQVNANALGIIWISPNELTNKTPGFIELNYLLDGLLSMYVSNPDKDQTKGIDSFFTKSFGKTFFLIHLNTHTQDKAKTIELLKEQIALINSLKSENKTILTLDLTNDQFINEIKGHFQSLEFKSLTL